MDSRLEREDVSVIQMRYHDWILHELRKLKEQDNEISRESGNSSLDSLERGIGWTE